MSVQGRSIVTFVFGLLMADGLAGCNGPPPRPPAVPTWCNEVRQVLPEGFSCVEFPGWFETGFYGIRKSPNDSTFRSGCVKADDAAFDTEVLRDAGTLESFSIELDATRQVGAQLSVDLSSIGSWAKKWLPQGGIKAVQTGSVKVSISFKNVGIKKVSNVPQALLRRLTSYPPESQDYRILDKCRDALCKETPAGPTEPVWTVATVVGTPVITVQSTSGSDIGIDVDAAKFGEFDVGAQEASSGKVTLTGKKPLAIAGMLRESREQLQQYGVCDAEPPAPATALQVDALRKSASRYAVGWLETYPCLWMRIGAEVSSRMCSGPCTPGDLLDFYDKTLDEFTADHRKSLCDAVQMVVGPMAGGGVTFDCAAVTAWFNFNGQQKFCGRDGSGLGTCTSGVLGTHELQLGLIRDLVDRMQGMDKAEFSRRFADGWSSLSGTQEFTRAKQAWDEAVAACGAEGCSFRVEGGLVTTRSAWPEVQGKLFATALDFFARAPRVPVELACPGAKMCYRAGRGWHFQRPAPARGACFSWEGTPANLEEAASDFSSLAVQSPVQGAPPAPPSG